MNDTCTYICLKDALKYLKFEITIKNIVRKVLSFSTLKIFTKDIFLLGIHFQNHLISFHAMYYRKRCLRGRVVKVADFKSLARHRCGFEPHSGRTILHVRKPSSWRTEGAEKMFRIPQDKASNSTHVRRQKTDKLFEHHWSHMMDFVHDNTFSLVSCFAL